MDEQDQRTISLEVRDGRPAILLRGEALSVDEADALHRQLAVMIKAARLLSGQPGRLRDKRPRAVRPSPPPPPKPVEDLSDDLRHPELERQAS